LLIWAAKACLSAFLSNKIDYKALDKEWVDVLCFCTAINFFLAEHVRKKKLVCIFYTDTKGYNFIYKF